MVQHPLCRQLQISRREVRNLLEYLQLGPADWTNLARIHEFIDPDLDVLVGSVYEHVLAFDQLRHLLSSPGVLDRLHLSMRAHLLSLGRDVTTLDYFEERLRVGFAHEGIGLELRWYVGTYPFITSWIGRRLAKHTPPGSPDYLALTSSLNKVLALDAMLAVETYHFASNQRLEDVLSEQYLVEHDLRRTTAKDSLTGVMNRRPLLESIEVEFLRSQRYRYQFVVLLLDVDSFKSINDELGHGFGDFVLRRIVERIRAVLRPEDIIGRYGGDEILVGLPGCAQEEAFQIAERIRLKVALSRIERDDTCAPVTLSIGLAALRPQIQTPEELLEQADRALYAAKRSGRNRTCVFDPRKSTDPRRVSSESAR